MSQVAQDCMPFALTLERTVTDCTRSTQLRHIANGECQILERQYIPKLWGRPDQAEAVAFLQSLIQEVRNLTDNYINGFRLQMDWINISRARERYELEGRAQAARDAAVRKTGNPLPEIFCIAKDRYPSWEDWLKEGSLRRRPRKRSPGERGCDRADRVRSLSTDRSWSLESPSEVTNSLPTTAASTFENRTRAVLRSATEDDPLCTLDQAVRSDLVEDGVGFSSATGLPMSATAGTPLDDGSEINAGSRTSWVASSIPAGTSDDRVRFIDFFLEHRNVNHDHQVEEEWHAAVMLSTRAADPSLQDSIKWPLRPAVIAHMSRPKHEVQAPDRASISLTNQPFGESRTNPEEPSSTGRIEKWTDATVDLNTSPTLVKGGSNIGRTAGGTVLSGTATHLEMPTAGSTVLDASNNMSAGTLDDSANSHNPTSVTAATSDDNVLAELERFDSISSLDGTQAEKISGNGQDAAADTSMPAEVEHDERAR